MKEYTPQQAHEADISLYNRLLSDKQKTGPGKMPERSTSTAHASETTGWGKTHLAISGVSHQPYVQTGHHSRAMSVGLSMDGSLVSGDTPSLNYTSSWMPGYYASVASNESLHEFDFLASKASRPDRPRQANRILAVGLKKCRSSTSMITFHIQRYCVDYIRTLIFLSNRLNTGIFLRRTKNMKRPAPSA
jgi:hypothetical protein